MALNLIPLKERILDYLSHLTTYDYIAYGWLVAVVFGFLLLTLLLANKKPKTATFLLLLVLLGMFVGPFALKYGLDRTLRNVVIVEKNATELPYSKNLVVTGVLQNFGKVSIQKCRLFVKVLREDSNRYKEMLYMLKPLRKKLVVLDVNLSKEQKLPYRIVLDHFKPKYPYHIKQSVECY